MLANLVIGTPAPHYSHHFIALSWNIVSSEAEVELWLKPCSRPTVKTCHPCNLFSWKCFCGLTWFSSCPIQSPHFSVCFRMWVKILNTAQFIIQRICADSASSLGCFPSTGTYVCQHWRFSSDCSRPCLSRCVLCVVESQGSKSASPFHADLQPLICGSHEGRTSLKDVVRLSTFKLDISSSTGDQKHLRLVPEPPFLM